MIKEKSKSPEIRFPGFTDDWEQRKLGEVSKFRQGVQVDLEKQYIENSDCRERFIRIVDYTQGTDDIRYIDRIDNANYVDVDDVVVVRYGATAGFVGHGIKGIIANNMFTINPSEVIHKKFLYTFMKQDRMYESLNSSNGSSAMPAINFGIMNNIDISYPSIDEQERIGVYFDNLDHLITLHQRKCDAFKELKKAMLQKMFPKNGTTVPEIRFPGFTGDWEQRKFGTLLNETRDKTVCENEDTLLSCAIDGMYLNSELFSHFRGSSNIGYLKIKKNDLILSAQNLHLGNCNVNLRFEHGIISPAYKVYELCKCDPLFVQAWIKKDSTKDFFLRAATEGASVCRKNIVWEELYKQELPVPNIEEQEKIGVYFHNLDHLITLHQRKCDALKELKKGMLQKMFV